MSEPKKLKIKPYARLLTMLGDQLIRNERVALMELIKNSYDADSPWVKISFENFGENFEKTNESLILIEDAGHGMSEDVVENHLAHPATPEKKLRKQKNIRTKLGRVIQGEKGIGRFAILKLGRKIEIITREPGAQIERVIVYDFTAYDEEFLIKESGDSSKTQENKIPFIDDLTIEVSERTPMYFTGKRSSKEQFKTLDHGTRIQISSLNSNWSSSKVEKAYDDIARLQSIFAELMNPDSKIGEAEKFDVRILKDQNVLQFGQNYQEALLKLMTEQAVLKVENGRYDEERKEISFNLNGHKKTFSLFDPEISALSVFNTTFGMGGERLKDRNSECGSFGFGFYVFDFRANAPPKYKLDKEDKKLLKAHRVYLYRDGIRVFPYGEPEDDWLNIDVDRGTKAASEFLSNDQVVGFVTISQEHNPKLLDKTNREGLIEYGNATEEFRTLIRTILKYLRKTAFKIYLDNTNSRKIQQALRDDLLTQKINSLKERLSKDSTSKDMLSKVAKLFDQEKSYLIRRAETTEELAGVGISVETASHDIMAVMTKAMSSIDGLIKTLYESDETDEETLELLQSIRGALSFVEAQLKDIQLLFKSSKQRSRQIRVVQLLEKVELIYRRLLKKNGVTLEIDTIGSPLVAKTTDAVLLQLLINLFDNAIYWLMQTSQQDKLIRITLDGNDGVLIFSDNGPGVSKDDIDYIFDPFFSGKGEEGRGLGLYIARQLLERYDYSIELAELKSHKILGGANFVVSFVREE